MGTAEDVRAVLTTLDCLAAPDPAEQHLDTARRALRRAVAVLDDGQTVVVVRHYRPALSKPVDAENPPVGATVHRPDCSALGQIKDPGEGDRYSDFSVPERVPVGEALELLAAGVGRACRRCLPTPA